MKKYKIQKSLCILLVFTLSLLMISFLKPIDALNESNLKGKNFTTSNGTVINLDFIKSKLIGNLDKKIVNIQNFKNNVSSADIDESDKVLINGYIDKIISDLGVYKIKIQNASSLQELNTIRTDANKYIAQNKNQIRNAVKELRKALNDEVVAQLEKIIKVIDASIMNLSSCCPGQTPIIKGLSITVNSLIRDLSDLNTMVLYNQSQESIRAKQEEIYTDVSAALYTLGDIMEKCELYKVYSSYDLAVKCNVNLTELADYYNITEWKQYYEDHPVSDAP